MQTDVEFTCQPPLGRLRIVGELDESTVEHLSDVLESLASLGCTTVEVDVRHAPGRGGASPAEYGSMGA